METRTIDTRGSVLRSVICCQHGSVWRHSRPFKINSFSEIKFEEKNFQLDSHSHDRRSQKMCGF